MLHKGFCKWGCRFWPHGNKGTHKLHTTTHQVELNVQSLIDLCANTMPHQMKGIRNGRHDVQCLLLDMWKNLWKRSDEIRYNEQMGIYLVVFSAFAYIDYCR
jgi:hypothetical protein